MPTLGPSPLRIYIKAMESTLPLRDRKKVKQRKALADASVRLFLKQGYAGTTLEQICAECDVTVPTLLRYFPTKEDLLFSRQVDFLETAADALKTAAADGRVIETWLQFLRASSQKIAANSEVIDIYRIIVETPVLLAKFHVIIDQYRSLLERMLCEQEGVKPGQDVHLLLLSHLLTVGPIEESLRALGEGDVKAMARRSDAAAKYILENFKRPAKKISAKAKPKTRKAV